MNPFPSSSAQSIPHFGSQPHGVNAIPALDVDSNFCPPPQTHRFISANYQTIEAKTIHDIDEAARKVEKTPKALQKAEFIERLVDTASHMIEQIWPSKTPSNPEVEVIPVNQFITEILRRSKSSFSTVQLSLYYIYKFRHHMDAITSLAYPSPSADMTMQCGRRMFLAALILASKYLQDKNYSNKAWSKISGLPAAEISLNERTFLRIIDYTLFVNPTVFAKWTSALLAHINNIQSTKISQQSLFDVKLPPGAVKLPSWQMAAPQTSATSAVSLPSSHSSSYSQLLSFDFGMKSSTSSYQVAQSNIVDNLPASVRAHKLQAISPDSSSLSSHVESPYSAKSTPDFKSPSDMSPKGGERKSDAMGIKSKRKSPLEDIADEGRSTRSLVRLTSGLYPSIGSVMVQPSSAHSYALSTSLPTSFASSQTTIPPAFSSLSQPFRPPSMNASLQSTGFAVPSVPPRPQPLAGAYQPTSLPSFSSQSFSSSNQPFGIPSHSGNFQNTSLPAVSHMLSSYPSTNVTHSQFQYQNPAKRSIDHLLNSSPSFDNEPPQPKRQFISASSSASQHFHASNPPITRHSSISSVEPSVPPPVPIPLPSLSSNLYDPLESNATTDSNGRTSQSQSQNQHFLWNSRPRSAALSLILEIFNCHTVQKMSHQSRTFLNGGRFSELVPRVLLCC